MENENKTDGTNEGLVLNPKFIPVYTDMVRSGYTYLECIIFGFVDFFLSNNNRFYCTNEQLAEMLDTSVKTISTAISKLKNNNLIEVNYELKKGGGKVRYIQLYKNVKSDFTKMLSPTLQKCKGIENKIIDNKNNNKNTKKEFEDFWKLFPHARPGKKNESSKYFNELDVNEVMREVKHLKRKIKSGVIDGQYIPACQRWLRDFTPTSEEIKSRELERIMLWNLKTEGAKDRFPELSELYGAERLQLIAKKISKTLDFNQPKDVQI